MAAVPASVLLSRVFFGEMAWDAEMVLWQAVLPAGDQRESAGLLDHLG